MQAQTLIIDHQQKSALAESDRHVTDGVNA